MTVELVPVMKRSHPFCCRHAEGLFGMEWIGSVVPRLRLSLSPSLFILSFLLAVCLSLLAFALLPPPAQLSRLSPSRAVGWSGFLGCGCCGDIWKIVAYWLAIEGEEEEAGFAGNPPS